MKQVYLDNAATTPLDPIVLEAMLPYMSDFFGNPSSTHSFGRKTRNGIELARKKIADYLNALPGEIIFTSGGTEADNMAIRRSVIDLGVQRIITSKIEHHAVGHTAEDVESIYNTKVEYVNLSPTGHVDLEHLEELLKGCTKKTLVSLMHANNEIGNLLPLKTVSSICRKYDAYFHSDTVQTMGHYKMDLKSLDIDFITGAAHKFHGPKGVGFLYIKHGLSISRFISGGGQERNHRGGTENVYGIIGLGKAMEIAHEHMEAHQTHIQGLKTYMIEQLKASVPGVGFNGDVAPESSLYTVLNVCFPKDENSGMFLFKLDMKGIAASGGSACSSGSTKGSHVLAELEGNEECQSIRFSFGRFTTKDEIDYTLQVIQESLKIPVQ